MTTSAAHEVIVCNSISGGELPEGWALTTIGTAFEINPRKVPKDGLPENALVTFVPMPAVDAESRTITAPQEKPFSSVRKGYTSFRENDVLFAKITPCMENGKAAIARALKNRIGFGSTEFHVLRPTGATIPEYVYHLIGQESFRREAESEMTGSVGQKRVPPSYLEDAPLYLPPLVEQKRIVARVEALLARVNSARERLAKVPAILKQFRQSVLAAACSGQLTANWRETALGRSDLCVKGELPNSWGWSSVKEVCGALVDCPHSTPKWTVNGRICVRTTEFRPGHLDLFTARFVSDETYKERVRRLEPKPGDVLYSREGTVGVACQIPKGVSLCLGQRMMLLRAGAQIEATFLMHILNAPLTLNRVQELTMGSTAPRVNVAEIKRFPVPLPPFSEQQEIVRRVEALFDLADRIEQRTKTATERVKKTTQSILARAFRGELVETEAGLARCEGREYETAAQLLERIISINADSPKSTKNQRKGRKKAQNRATVGNS